MPILKTLTFLIFILINPTITLSNNVEGNGIAKQANLLNLSKRLETLYLEVRDSRFYETSNSLGLIERHRELTERCKDWIDDWEYAWYEILDIPEDTNLTVAEATLFGIVANKSREIQKIEYETAKLFSDLYQSAEALESVPRLSYTIPGYDGPYDLLVDKADRFSSLLRKMAIEIQYTATNLSHQIERLHEILKSKIAMILVSKKIADLDTATTALNKTFAAVDLIEKIERETYQDFILFDRTFLSGYSATAKSMLPRLKLRVDQHIKSIGALSIDTKFKNESIARIESEYQDSVGMISDRIALSGTLNQAVKKFLYGTDGQSGLKGDIDSSCALDMMEKNCSKFTWISAISSEQILRMTERQLVNLENQWKSIDTDSTGIFKVY